jgi:hypothetical protein
MAIPNLISSTSVIGKTHAEWVLTSPSAILTNPSVSNSTYKINSLFVTNLNSNDALLTVDLYRNSVSYKLAYQVPVATKSSLVVIGKDTSIYLEEGDELRLLSNLPGALQFVISYEIMS